MRIAVAAFLAIAVALSAAGASRAEETDAPNPAHPWEKDQALLATVQEEAISGGITAVEPSAADMESALSAAKLAYVVDEPGGAVSYSLTYGDAEALGGTAKARKSRQNPQADHTIAVKNPYPEIAFYLGAYYDSADRPADGLRVLDLGLSLSPVVGLDLGEHRAMLLAERGAALGALQRWPDMLADYDDGLKIDGLDTGMKAMMDRGRGMALTGLGRLDEAEAAYNESLKNEPGNANARDGLSYIARLRAENDPAAAAATHDAPLPPNDPGAGGHEHVD